MGQPGNQKTLVSAIIPAYQEEQTIAEVVRTIRSHPTVSEVLVIDDGSRDRTAVVAEQAGAIVWCCSQNEGKAAAMDVGVEHAKNDILFFADADLHGLTHEMISRLAEPVISGRYDLCIGIRNRNIYRLNTLLRLIPLIGGERVMTKSVWALIPERDKRKFRIEIAMNYHTKAAGKKMKAILLPGLTQVVKEKKYGYVRGFLLRLAMIGDILAIAIHLYVFENIRLWYRRHLRHEQH